MKRVAAAALAVLAMAAVTAGVVTAAGGDADGANAPRHALEVELDEWRLSISTDSLEAGSIRLSQSNTGRQEHELLIVRTDLAPDDLPMGLEGVSPAAAGKVVYGAPHSHHSGSPDDNHHLAPGASKSEQVRLRPGRYVLLCSIPGHYEAGQRAAVTVG